MSRTVEDRVTKVEAEVSSLTSTVDRLARVMDSHASSTSRSFDRVEKMIETLSARQTDGSKINWTAVGTAFVILIAVLGYFVDSRIRPLEARTDEEVIKNRRQTDEIVRLQEATTESHVKWELWEKGLLRH